MFGGGHVVLPLLEKIVIPLGWVNKEEFLIGYAATQAVPGPLFTFASYLGAIIGGLNGAIIATIAIFLPAYLLIIGVLPFWERLRENQLIQSVLTSIQAAVIGILLAALYNPIWITSIYSVADFIYALILFIM